MASPVTIKTVVVVGASGQLGGLITRALVITGFDVTVLARSAAVLADIPPGVTAVRHVDFNNLSDLTNALEDQDAVVSAIGTMAVGQQRVLIEAASYAGVKRFVPSEYGLNTRIPGLKQTKLGRMLKPKIDMIDRLIQLSEKSQGKFTWTGVGNNLFFDSSLEAGLLGIDLHNRKATIVDSGDEPFSTSNREQVARAVVGVLKKPQETANKYVMVQSFVTTQNELLRAAREVMQEEGKRCEFQVEHITAADTEAIADRMLAQGKAFDAFWAYVRQYQFADGAGRALRVEETANELFGLKEENMRESIRRVIKRMPTLRY